MMVLKKLEAWGGASREHGACKAERATVELS